MFPIRQVPASEIIDLRHAILRAGLPRESALFPGDDSPAAAHFAAYNSDNQLIGCLTLHPSEWESQPAYQLRGMAVTPEMQRHGVGRALLAAAESFIRATPTQTLWCNARTPVIPFYQNVGWSIISDQFEVPTAGPHVRMIRHLPQQPQRGERQ